MADHRESGDTLRYWRSLEPRRLLGPLALTGAAGGALWILLSGGVLPDSQPGGPASRLLYAWWAPGLLFGIAFSATLRLEPRTALAFATVTGVIFSAAVGLTLGLTSLRLDIPLIAVPWEGIISGALAAWLFHRASALFLALQTTTRAVSVVILGSLGAGALTQLMSNPGANKLALVLASAACAAGVGYSSFGVLARSTRLDESSYLARMGSLLHSEAVQTLGLVATLTSMISLLAALL